MNAAGDRFVVTKVRRARGRVSFGTVANAEYVLPADDRAVSRFERLPAPRGALRIPLLELQEHQCRFPLGAGELYCGIPEGDRKPYCPFHAGIAYNR